MKDSAMPVANLRNIGAKSATMLAHAGIRTRAELKALGAVKAYVRLKSAFPSRVTLNMLWAIAAALDNRDWRALGGAEKSRLLDELRRS